MRRNRLPLVVLGIVFLGVLISLGWILQRRIYALAGVDLVQGPAAPFELPSPSPTPTLPSATATPDLEASSTALAASLGADNCTSDRSFWLEHLDSWRVEELQIGGRSYPQAEAVAILEASSSEPTVALIQQFILYVLNTLQGADPSVIAPAVKEARVFLEDHPMGEPLTETEAQNASAIALAIRTYNEGKIGPGMCPDRTSTPTPSLTPTVTPTPTLTPTVTPTPTNTLPIPTRTSTKPPTPRVSKTSPPPPPSPTPRPPTQPPPTQPPPTQPPPPPPTPTPIVLPTTAPSPSPAP